MRVLTPISGSSAASGTLTLTSTTHGTKGKIFLGASSAYDEATSRLGIGKTNPTVPLDVVGAAAISGNLSVGGDLAVTGIGQTRYISKGTLEGPLTRTTVANDSTLTASVIAGTYDVFFCLNVDGGTTGDFQTAWSVPASSSGLRACFGPTPSAKATLTPGFDSRTNTAMRSSNHAFATAVPYSMGGGGSGISIIETSLVVVTTPGNIVLQWAQAAADITGAQVYGSSWMKITRAA